MHTGQWRLARWKFLANRSQLCVPDLAPSTFMVEPKRSLNNCICCISRGIGYAARKRGFGTSAVFRLSLAGQQR